MNGRSILALLPAVLLSIYLPLSATAGVICASYAYAPNLVRRLQEKLNTTLSAQLAVDGKWGRKTQDALRRFQSREKLRVSGDLDEDTFRALFGDVAYEGIEIVRNPTNAPRDAYERMCRGEGSMQP